MLGGFLAAGLGLSWMFLMTGAVLGLNLVWVSYRVPEYQVYQRRSKPDGWSKNAF
jgi:hypothetical protein